MGLLPRVEINDPSLQVKTRFGVLRNPIGLAAGLDKTGEHLSALEKLGFGYMAAGTVTLNPWPGNPKPRIVRNVKENTIVNCLGFPNPGVDRFVENLSKQKVSIPIVGSVSGQTVDDIVSCWEKLQSHVAAIELNLSSPNTAKLKDLREFESFKELVTRLRPLKAKPAYLKIPPLLDGPESQFVEKSLSLVKLWHELGFDGATVANSKPVVDKRLSIGTGGYSGPPLFPNVIRALDLVRKSVSDESFEINAVGGISSVDDVKTALRHGAKTVQIYTALVYEGPGLLKRILKRMLDEDVNRKKVAQVQAGVKGGVNCAKAGESIKE